MTLIKMNLSYFIVVHNAFTFVIIKIIATTPSTIDWEFFLVGPAVIKFKLLLGGSLNLIKLGLHFDQIILH